jgi:hypothetical protein
MPSKPHVPIAGAGIGGIVAALSLLQRGFDVDLYEQATDLQEIGAGVQISANGSRVLCALGLEAAMTGIASVPVGKEVRLFSTGQAWKMYDVGAGSVERYGAPYWMVHRADFHQVLLHALEARKPGAIHLGARCTGFEQDGTAATLLTQDGQRIRGDVLVGADGVHSRIRNGLFGESKAQFTGFIGWRAVIPMERLPERMRRAYGVNWMGPHGHVVTYPLRRGELLNLVTAIERDDWLGESWSEPGEMASSAPTWRSGTTTSSRSSTRLTSPTNGPCSAAIRSTPGRSAASPCSATPATRRCPSLPRAPTWPSRTAWCWPAASKPTPTRPMPCATTTLPAATAPPASSAAQRTTCTASTTRNSPTPPARRTSSAASSIPTACRNATTGCSNTTP